MLFYTDSQTYPSGSFVMNGTGFEGFFHVIEPTGLPYTVVVDSLIGPSDSVQAGDEIGIFDGNTPECFPFLSIRLFAFLGIFGIFFVTMWPFEPISLLK